MMKNSRLMYNNMYECPICHGKPQLVFGVGKRNADGYPVVAHIHCSNGCLSTDDVEFEGLGKLHQIWNDMVISYNKNQ